MFNSLATYLFGKSKENNLNTEENNKSSSENLSTNQSEDLFEIDENIKLTAILCDEDRDWLLVEKEYQSDNDTVDYSITENESNKNLQLVPFKNILSHLGSTNGNDEIQQCLFSANLPSLYPNTMDDSFLLLPPSCFSSASIQLETSPMENLLLEHPSMSVYSIRRNSLNGISNNDMIDDLVLLELTQNDIENESIIIPKNRKNVSVKNRNKSSNGSNKNLTLVFIRKDAQKVQDQRKISMGKSAIERNNKRYAPKKRTNLPTINQPSSRTLINRKN